MPMNGNPFDYLSPTGEQKETMQRVRDAAKVFADVLVETLPDGPDRTYVIRSLRTVAMWANVAITRQPNGEPRQ
jgi:hypothetical protein